jgi:hypothetical protein
VSAYFKVVIGESDITQDSELPEGDTKALPVVAVTPYRP